MSCNVGNTYVNFAKKSITKYMRIILDKYFDKNIFSVLLDTYIDVRYYNYYDGKYKSFEANINYYMKEKAMGLLENNNNNKSDIIKKTFHLFKYILYFDDVIPTTSLKDIVSEITDYRVNELALFDNEYEQELIDLVRENNKNKKVFFDSFESSRFMLKLSKTNNKNIIYSDISYNINFPKIYSEYSKNKVYSTGIVNEKIFFIKYYLLSSLILKEVISGGFNRKYISSFSISLFDKKEKVDRFLEIINNDCIKEKFIISFTYEEYINNKDKINELISLGYKIAVFIDDKFVLNEINKRKLDIFSYILTNEIMYKDIFDGDRLIIIEK